MDYREKIKDCNTLDDLFFLWKKEHEREPEDSCRGVDGQGGTFPRKNGTPPNYEPFKDSFCPDGVTSRAGNESSTNRCQVLFILKELNVTATDGNYNDSFWFNEKVEDPVRNKYAQRFDWVIQRLIETQGLKQEDSKTYGYMNLNKRGGYGNNDEKYLKAYVKKYLPFIEKQISLLSPKYIVCCGNYELLRKELFKTTDKHNPSKSIYPQQYKFAQVYNVCHPSIKDEKKFIRSLDFRRIA